MCQPGAGCTLGAYWGCEVKAAPAKEGSEGEILSERKKGENKWKESSRMTMGRGVDRESEGARADPKAKMNKCITMRWNNTNYHFSMSEISAQSVKGAVKKISRVRYAWGMHVLLPWRLLWETKPYILNTSWLKMDFLTLNLTMGWIYLFVYLFTIFKSFGSIPLQQAFF